MHESNASMLKATVFENETLSVSPTIKRIVLDAPIITRTAKPGQFVHLALPEGSPHVLRRPFSIFELSRTGGVLTVLYQVVGEGTRLLSEVKEGSKLSVMGPLGSGWDFMHARRPLLIGGGVGAAPLLLLARDIVSRGISLDVILGASTADMLVCQEFFEGLGKKRRLHLCTDDGSRGFKGFTTELAAELLASKKFDYIASCGPEPMQKLVAELAANRGISCEVSLERRMACGVGACLSCVVDTPDGKKRACVDGPVFNAQEVIW